MAGNRPFKQGIVMQKDLKALLNLSALLDIRIDPAEVELVSDQEDNGPDRGHPCETFGRAAWRPGAHH